MTTLPAPINQEYDQKSTEANLRYLLDQINELDKRITQNKAESEVVSPGFQILTEQDTNPTINDLGANDAITIYSKANTFVIAYNDAGTMTFLTIPLDGSTTLWTHGTVAP